MLGRLRMSVGECIVKYEQICQAAYTEKKKFALKNTELFSASRFETELKRLVLDRGYSQDEDERMHDPRESAPKV